MKNLDDVISPARQAAFLRLANWINSSADASAPLPAEVLADNEILWGDYDALWGDVQPRTIPTTAGELADSMHIPLLANGPDNDDVSWTYDGPGKFENPRLHIC